MTHEAIYKGATRPAMKLGIPLVPLVVLFGLGMLLSIWGGILVSGWVAVVVVLAIAIIVGLSFPALALAQGFDKINTTVTNVQTILVTISIAVVTIAIIWAGFKMIFQGARLADVANVLIGGTLIGGAAAFASYIVT